MSRWHTACHACGCPVWVHQYDGTLFFLPPEVIREARNVARTVGGYVKDWDEEPTNCTGLVCRRRNPALIDHLGFKQADPGNPLYDI